jgi:type II secretory pathway component PulK
MTPKTNPPAGKRLLSRRGAILVVVMIVVVFLSLAAYQYTDMMTAEYKATDNAVRYNQVRMLCESGINYTCALLADPNNLNNLLGGNPYYNPQYFKDIVVMEGSHPRDNGKFSIFAPTTMPNDPDGANGPAFGVFDEGGKININAVMRLDPSGNVLYAMLMQLPNMTDDIANAIVDWLDPDDNPRVSQMGGQGGAESSYYLSLSPPYMPKNGPIDSLEELLLVRGVTPDLLYGNDINRTGIQSQGSSSDGTFFPGWAFYLTVYSREQNIGSNGATRVYLNDQNMQNLASNLTTAGLNPDVATFIILYRVYGAANTGTTTTTTVTGNGNNTTVTTTTTGGNNGGNNNNNGGNNSNVIMAPSVSGFDVGSLNLANQAGKTQIKSVFDLINAYVDVPDTNNANNGKPTRYPSPLMNAASSGSTDLDALLSLTTIYQYTEIPGRINVNTAPPAVIQALAGVAPTLTTQDITNIIQNQPQYYNAGGADPSYSSSAWLMSKAGLTPDKMKALEKYITTSTQVYSFQVIGYFEEGGPVVRFEAVIDLNWSYNQQTNTLLGQPRILHQRDITELGKGWDPHGPGWGGGQ